MNVGKGGVVIVDGWNGPDGRVVSLDVENRKVDSERYCTVYLNEAEARELIRKLREAVNG